MIFRPRAVAFYLCIVLCLRGAVAARAAGPSDSAPLVAPTEALTPAEQLAKFHLPPGFAIQLVAAEPDIRKPMNLNFDLRGRLYATQSEEYPFPAEGDAPKRDVVKRFDNIGADGHPAAVTTVVTGLNIPIGLLPREDGLIYYSIPKIYRSTQPDAEGRYQKSAVLYGSFGYKDTHGMGSSFTRWIDGWVYGCHGYANDSELRGTDDQPVKMNSGNTYRFRPDGSHIEQFTHGQVNPFGLSFDPLGNLYSADCHTKPLYMLLRGAWYPSFGKPHDGLGYGPEMIRHLHGSTGIAGVVYYAAQQFPAEYRDTVFIGNPVTGRINRDRLEPHGSTYKAVALPDFISCEDQWFRPVDIKLGPDGALYIADFYNCIIGHYEVPLTHPRRDRTRGRIWRVVYTGTDGKTDQQPDVQPPVLEDFTRLNDTQLVERLGDLNLATRVMAAEQLSMQSPDQALLDQLRTALTTKETDDVATFRKAHAMWLLERFAPGGLSAEQIERLAADVSPLVRVHLVKALAERADWGTTSSDLYKLARAKLGDDDAFVRRAAADALGRHPQAENVEALLMLWKATPKDDTHLIHVVRMALRDQLLAPGVYAAVNSLVAENKDWTDRIADVSLGAHSSDAAIYLMGYVEQASLNPPQMAEYLHDVIRYCPTDRFADFTHRAAKLAAGPADRQHALLLAVIRATQERGENVSDELVAWGRRLVGELLASENKQSTKQGIELASELRIAESFDQLATLAGRDAPFADLRAAAIDACVINNKQKAVPTLAAIVGDSTDQLAQRQKAATALAGLKTPEAKQALLAQLRNAPDRLAVEIARGLAIDPDSRKQLVAEIKAGHASPQLLRDSLVIARVSRDLSLADDINRLTAGLPPVDDLASKLIASRRKGFDAATPDAAAGKQVFLKTCGVCHRIGEEGAKIGPELHGVGLRGVDRLLEDVLDPSRNVDQAFRTTQIETSGGQVVSGLLLREDGEVVVIVDPQGKEVRIPAGDVADLVVNNLSPMPANIADLIPEADFYNLLAFLLEQKQKVEK